MQPKVAVLKTTPATVVEDYGRLIDMMEYRPKKDLLLKLNLSWSLYYPACSTEPWQLEGALKGLTDRGITRIIPVENKTVVTHVMKGARGNKWLPLFDRYGVKFRPLDREKWVRMRLKSDLKAIPEIFPDGLRIPKLFIGKSMLHLPTIKTHGHTVMTGTMKNAFGGLITERRHHCHKNIHEVLVDLLKIQKELHPDIFTLMDGTVCGDGAGPRTMIPRIENIILAGSDQVAVDAVSSKLMGYDPMRIRFLKQADDEGLGTADTDQIDIVGEDISRTNFHFATHKSPVIFWDQAFRKGALRFLEPLLFHTPLFKLPVFASAFYHDYMWYPTVGKARIRRFMKTEWGRLLRRY